MVLWAGLRLGAKEIPPQNQSTLLHLFSCSSYNQQKISAHNTHTHTPCNIEYVIYVHVCAIYFIHMECDRHCHCLWRRMGS